MSISIQPFREEAIRVGFEATKDRLPMSFADWQKALDSWTVQAFCEGEKVVGMLMTKGPELHVAVLPEVRGKWLSRRLLREIFAPLLDRYGCAVTKVAEGNDFGDKFVARVGFERAPEGHYVKMLREGFASGAFDPVSAAIAVGGSVAGGLMQAGAAENAANIQAGAARDATAEQRRQFDLSRNDLAPYRDAGQAAVQKLMLLLGLQPQQKSLDQIASELRNSGRFTLRPAAPQAPASGSIMRSMVAGVGGGSGSPTYDESALMAEARRLYEAQNAQPEGFGDLNKRFTIEDFQADPVNQLGLQFGLNEGEKAIRRMFGAQGMGRSGSAAKALTRYGTDYANSKAAESRARFLQDQDLLFNRLSGLSGTGQTATTNTAQLGAQTATNIGQNLMGAANARGAAAIAGGNALSAPFSQAANFASSKYLLDSLKPSGPQYGMDDLYRF